MGNPFERPAICTGICHPYLASPKYCSFHQLCTGIASMTTLDPLPHQHFDVCLKCLGQTLSDMSDMSGVTDMCLESGMFLSGSDIIVWHLSGHRLFSLHQTALRYTPDTYSRLFPASSLWSQPLSDSSQVHPRLIFQVLLSRAQITPDMGSNSSFKCIIRLLIGIICTSVHVLQSSFQLCGRQPSLVHHAIQLSTMATS